MDADESALKSSNYKFLEFLPSLTSLLSFLLSLLSLPSLFVPLNASEAKLKTLYNSLDPLSIAQHLAFYELYQPDPLAKQALQEAWKLLAGNQNPADFAPIHIPLSLSEIQTLISLVNKPIDKTLPLLDKETIEAFLPLSKRLSHVGLKGHEVWTEEEMQKLPIDQIDLARGLFLTQFSEDKQRILSYEALIDLMALQILARLPKNATDVDKIHAINAFIFDEMGFRFPPNSVSIKAVDRYSFLPSVLDSHRGVCLGVSILYLCIAQRLQLPLEMITPPGHIYVRYHSGDQIINIETTARGIHLACKEYLNVGTRSLQQRTIREVIGMAHFNQASVFWQNRDYEAVIEAYKKAEPYLRGDPVLKELLGYAYVITGKKTEGESLLNEIKDHFPDHAIVKGTMVDDYFLGNVDAEGIKMIFNRPDDDRKSLLKKKEEIENVLNRCPNFRDGILQLAMIWIQLHRAGESIEALNRFLILDTSDPDVHYYLAALFAQRHDYLKAWNHLQQCERILNVYSYCPDQVKKLRRELLTFCPEYPKK